MAAPQPLPGFRTEETEAVDDSMALMEVDGQFQTSTSGCYTHLTCLCLSWFTRWAPTERCNLT